MADESQQVVAGPAKPQSMLYEKCPVCDGAGLVQAGDDDEFDPCYAHCLNGFVETGATAKQLEYLAELDGLRQAAGITAAMLRDGRARAAMTTYLMTTGTAS